MIAIVIKQLNFRDCDVPYLRYEDTLYVRVLVPYWDEAETSACRERSAGVTKKTS